ncbi:5'-AMP-activated serine/threonine-protein kinase catalytic subunit alpha-like [Xenia sp. Carnegie-2017]|uniref:5'-AMP-activated serine/threonine-protein kinase catalytic subunit alpha-like n=1 Tax=Xenia sp. Carnegie-2017 TaxID=2897299 RepID=UPI001F036E8A|nr:5'-AMP-activated serine/threonine-protein kinase catalytic subunit alpha-like [Xenia sp. Carnegie-2017]
MKETEIKKLGNYSILDKTLGKGHFGYVKLAVHTLTNIKVAIKITEVHGEKASIIRRNCYREVLSLNQLDHPCIIKIHEIFKTTNIYYLVMEYVDGGSLLSFIRETPGSKLTENDSRWYFQQMVSAIDYLHRRHIVHRDLKMENILLHGMDKKFIKLIDFGFSNIFSKDDFLSTRCGSPEYAAPELFSRDSKYTTEVDVWSLGIILYGMAIGSLPFRQVTKSYGH